MMKIKVLFGLRKESYAGQYAPEALVVVDEFTDEENPDYFDEAARKSRSKYDEWMSFAVVEIGIDQEEVRRRCLNLQPTIPGTIVTEHS